MITLKGWEQSLCSVSLLPHTAKLLERLICLHCLCFFNSHLFLNLEWSGTTSSILSPKHSAVTAPPNGQVKSNLSLFFFSIVLISLISLQQLTHLIHFYWTSPVAQIVKNLPAMQETWIWPLGQEDSLEKGKATHSSSILAWRISWTRSLVGYSTWGRKESNILTLSSNFMALATSQMLMTPRFISSLGLSPELPTWMAGHLPSRQLHVDGQIRWVNMKQTGWVSLPPVLLLLYLWPLIRQQHHNLPCGPSQKPDLLCLHHTL